MEEEVKRLFGLDIVSILSDDQLDFTNAKQCTISLGEKMKIKLDILVHGTVDEKQSCYFFLIIECKRSNCQRAVKQLAVYLRERRRQMRMENQSMASVVPALILTL